MSDQRAFGAIDIGTNSFHLLVAEVGDDQWRTLDRIKERVALGEGLDEGRVLSGEAVERAHACLKRFAARIAGLPDENVRAVATSAVRTAKNGAEICSVFEEHLGHPIEVIDGLEEARLVFRGAATVRPVEGRRLIIDIGGGSTELASGTGEPDHLDSLHIGCINFTEGFFPEGIINKDRFRGALYSARLEIEAAKRRWGELHFDEVLGTSGTVRAVVACARALGYSKVDEEALREIRRRCIGAGEVEKLDLPEVSERRKPVIVGGLAILSAFVETFDCHVEACDGALRDGVLWELSSSSDSTVIRRRGVESLARHFDADSEQAERVWKCAKALFDRAQDAWGLGRAELDLLEDASMLHEIGLAVRYGGYHKHGAYLCENAALPGTSAHEQRAVAAMVLCHRRKFRHEAFEFMDEPERTKAVRTALLLRLAVRLCRTRTDPPKTKLDVDGEVLELTVESLDALTAADLEHEVSRAKRAGYKLSVG